MKERIAYHNEWLMHLSDAEAGKMWCKGRAMKRREVIGLDAEAGKMWCKGRAVLRKLKPRRDAEAGKMKGERK